LNHKLIGKVFSAVTIALLLGVYIQHDYAIWGQRGREAFLAHQTQRFDHYMAIPHPPALTFFGAIIVVFGTLAIYEHLVLAFSAALRTMSGAVSSQ
jgi:predicted small integral membrane protein